MLCYRARPIDTAGSDSNWYPVVDAVDIALRDAGILVFRPEGAFLVGPKTEVTGQLEAINRAALAQADVMIALLPPGVPSLGVGREIEAAIQLGIPVILVSEKSTWSAHDLCHFPFSTSSIPKLMGMVELLGDYAPPKIPGIEPPAAAPSTILFTLSDLLAQMPTRSYGGDAGFDLYVSRHVTIFPHEFADVHCGVRAAFPPGVWARITGRSSTIRNHGLLVIEGVIDNGYRGEMFAGCWNLSDTPVVLAPGDRVAQLIPHSLIPDLMADQISVEDFDKLPHDGRGAKGFGSSGR